MGNTDVRCLDGKLRKFASTSSSEKAFSHSFSKTALRLFSHKRTDRLLADTTDNKVCSGFLYFLAPHFCNFFFKMRGKCSVGREIMGSGGAILKNIPTSTSSKNLLGSSAYDDGKNPPPLFQFFFFSGKASKSFLF